MPEYTLLLAPSGVRLTASAQKIKDALGAAHADIEQEILANPDTENALRAIPRVAFATPIKKMETVVHNLPRSKVVELWRDAVGRCLAKLNSGQEPVRILTGHLIYYGAKRSDFYSAIDASLLAAPGGMKPSRVVLLIDDIYDIFVRLSSEAGLFSPSHVGPFLEKQADEQELNLRELHNDQLTLLTMTWKAQSLLGLLRWRSLELIMAENLALRLGVRLLLWPLKQLTRSLTRYLTDSHSRAIYLSHPITEARKHRNSEGEWPDFTDQVNRLQELLLKDGVTLLMPTAIDELRFELKRQLYTGRLNARWPMRSTHETLYAKPENVVSVDHTDLLEPKLWDLEKRRMVEHTPSRRDELAVLSQFLVSEIQDQIAARDFLYIYHCSGMLVFRPYYSRSPRNRFSSGVDSEVQLSEALSLLGGEQPIAFVHFRKDILPTLSLRNIQSEFVDALWGLLQPTCAVRREMVEQMARYKGDVPEASSVLSRGSVAQTDKDRIKRAFFEQWPEAKVQLLRKLLTNGVEVSKELIGIWVVEDFDEVVSECRNICAFLKDGSPLGNAWEEDIERLFPDRAILKE